MTAGWRGQAACLGKDATLFHPLGETWSGGREAEAKAICAGCPVTAECLRFGIESEDTWGVYGGLTAEERRSKPLRLPVLPARDPNRCAQGAHLLDEDNLGIDNLGHRFCKACKRKRSADAYKAKAAAKAAAQLQEVSA